MASQYLSMKEMSEALSISYTTLDNWIRKGIITPDYITPSGRKFFKQEQVDKYWSDCTERVSKHLGG